MLLFTMRNCDALRKFREMLLVALLIVLALMCSQAPAQSLNFVPDITSGDGEVTVQLRWNAPGASSCLASSTPQTSFDGERPSEGVEDVISVMFSTVFRLSCTWPGDRRAELTWTPPHNTNGTPLVDLAGYKIFHSLCAQSPVGMIPLSTPAATSHVIDNLPVGENCFWLQAVNAAGHTSADSNIARKTITGDREKTETVELQVNPKPERVTDLEAR
jgi:hypothetical protein